MPTRKLIEAALPLEKINLLGARAAGRAAGAAGLPGRSWARGLRAWLPVLSAIISP